MDKVVILGENGYNTLGLIHCLHDKSISFFLILVSDKKKNFVLSSKYIHSYIIVKNGEDGFSFLLKNKTYGVKRIVIPTSDRLASILDLNFDALSPFYIFPNVGRSGGLTRFMDKDLMTELAAKNGIQVPRTIQYNSGEEIPHDICFPCILKPLKSIEGKKKDIRKINNIEELKSYLSHSHFTKSFLIQKYVERDFDLLLIGCRNIDGTVFCPGLFKKLRWFANGDDGSYGIITSKIEQFINKNHIVSFLNEMNYVGPFSIEFGVEKGIPYFFEINLRNDGTTHYFRSININVPYIWVKSSLKEKYYIDSVNCNDKIFMDEFGDLLNVFRGNLSFCQWIKDLRSIDVYKYWNNDDRKPFYSVFPHMLCLIPYKIVKIFLHKY